jgi:hypothetical protein
MLARAAFTMLVALAVACSPQPAPVDAGTDGGNVATDCPNPPPHRESLSACRPQSSDYEPRVEMSAGDSWPACISDDNAYHPINPNISTVARVAAFEQIADLLWNGGTVPTADDFLSARIIYAQDQGLDSRVQRREDVHYAAAAQPCSMAGVPEQNPDRCVGPAKLLPILNDAFLRGAMGEAPRLHAARIEAALLWFLYISALSEVMSCGARPQDCDSAWAYYSGGTPRGAPVGLARYVNAFSPATHDRAYDGTLAVRCWRNLDNETGLAADPSQQLQARNQLDRAMLRGVAVVLRQRVTELACADEQGAEARTAFIKILAGLVHREALARDASWAQALAGGTSGTSIDVSSATTALDMLFPCP